MPARLMLESKGKEHRRWREVCRFLRLLLIQYRINAWQGYTKGFELQTTVQKNKFLFISVL